MTNKPFFSIVIPTLNEEHYLPHLLKCLEKQTFQNFETLVVDGHSDDKTQQIAQKKAKLLNLQVIKSNVRDVRVQRNLGVKRSKADIIVFFDADTTIGNNFLSKLKTFFLEKNPDVVTTWIKADSKKDKDKIINIGNIALFEISKFLGTPALYGAMFAIKKNVFNKLGGFDEKLKFAEETELVRKAVDKGFKYEISRDNYYILSLRRFRKEGTMNMLQKYFILCIAYWFKMENLKKSLDYPMGGHIYNGKPSLQWFKRISQDMRNKQTSKSKLKFKAFLKKLKTELDKLGE